MSASAVSTVVALAALLGLSVLMAFLGAAEAAARLISRGRVRRFVSAQRHGARDLDRIMERPGRLLATRALAAALSYAASGALLTWAISTTYDSLPMWLSTLVALLTAALVLFVFGEALPRTVALRNPEHVALVSARAALILTAVLYPLARGLSLLWTWGISHEDIFAGGGDDEPDEAQEELIESVERFSDRIVREVMVPRTDMKCLEDTATAAEALDLIREAGFSRMPVFHENLDDIRGVLYARDLLLALGDGWDPDMRVSRLVRPALFVPETKPVRELLVQMRKTAHMALVADEYGGTAGLVTIEDLLEEIVGEIFDEYDRQVPMVVHLGDGRHRVDARVPVIELDELFETAIELEADSVGGLFIEEVGHIPDVGEAVDIEGLRLVVDEMAGNRILHLIVEPIGVRTREEGPDERDHTD